MKYDATAQRFSVYFGWTAFYFFVAKDEDVRIEDGRLTETITTYDAVTDSPKSPPPNNTCGNNTDLMQGVGPSANNRGAGHGAALLKRLPKLQ